MMTMVSYNQRSRSKAQNKRQMQLVAAFFAMLFFILTCAVTAYAAEEAVMPDTPEAPGPVVTVLWSPEIRAAAKTPEAERKTMPDSNINADSINSVSNDILESGGISAAFYITEITDEIFARIKGKSYKDNCTVPVTDLRYLHLLHKDLDGVTHEGEMICNVKIAEDVLEIFRALYDAGYPIEKVRLVDEYDADDERSMADNNCSSFNFRTVSYSTKLSNHALGLAVDINPLYNPYIKTLNGKPHIEPANAGPYVDRSANYPYKLEEGDLCYRLFTEHGFSWGGHWQSCKDYQHFEKTFE